MSKKIQLTYRQLIDQESAGIIEREIFLQSFSEFALKCQEYNTDNTFFSFSAIKSNNPKANSLHYKTGLATGDIIKKYNNTIPGLTDNLSRAIISFEKFELEIVESNPFNIAEHQVAIYFITGTLLLHEIVHDYFILSDPQSNSTNNKQPLKTFSLKMQPGLSVSSYSIFSHQYQNESL